MLVSGGAGWFGVFVGMVVRGDVAYYTLLEGKAGEGSGRSSGHRIDFASSMEKVSRLRGKIDSGLVETESCSAHHLQSHKNTRSRNGKTPRYLPISVLTSRIEFPSSQLLPACVDM